jgi:hypothetical protein
MSISVGSGKEGESQAFAPPRWILEKEIATDKRRKVPNNSNSNN